MTYIRKYLMLTLAAFLCVTTLRAQVDNQYTQYYMVPGYYNPSAIGNTDYIHVTVGSRASTSARAFSTSTSTGGQVSQPRTSHNPRWR